MPRGGRSGAGGVSRQPSEVTLPSMQAELPSLQNTATGKTGDRQAPPLLSPASEVGGIGMSLARGPHPAELATWQGETTAFCWAVLSWGALLQGCVPSRWLGRSRVPAGWERSHGLSPRRKRSGAGTMPGSLCRSHGADLGTWVLVGLQASARTHGATEVLDLTGSVSAWLPPDSSHLLPLTPRGG